MHLYGAIRRARIRETIKGIPPLEETDPAWGAGPGSSLSSDIALCRGDILTIKQLLSRRPLRRCFAPKVDGENEIVRVSQDIVDRNNLCRVGISKVINFPTRAALFIVAVRKSNG